MSQFRTTADILDEILQKSGEPTNGNSPYETLARTYANKVHHAIIAGGNIFELNVDEPWMWARSRFPIAFELQPAYTSGTVNITADSTDFAFTTASAVSLEGWHFQVNGKSTVYKIMNHTAGSTTAQLDSGFIDSTGAYSFRAFKLDYEITPTYMYVDNTNDRLDFQETAATTLNATITHGAYTQSGLITHVVSRLNATGTATWSGAYDSVAKSFNLSSSVTSKLYNLSGSNYKRSILSTLGFDRIDYTGAQTYTSTYMPGQVSRLIEPFKLFASGCSPFIYSTDTIRMQEDYPISNVSERIPDRFCRLTEDADGSIWVRFNTYPKDKIKVTVDWIPQPIDLQDNTASRVLLPRQDVDTLIHAACAYICYDKEDSKWEGFLKLAGAGLAAMQKKNRALLFRTGEFFAQQVPREDMRGIAPKPNYGYTAGDGG